MRKIPLSVPNLKGNEKKYISEAIDAEWISTGGKYIDEFENKISEYLNIEGAVACQSGTAGLHIAMLLLNVQQNDEVLVSPLTFIAAVNPIKYVGAHPVFLDVDQTLCISPESIEKFIKENTEMRDGFLVNIHTERIIKAMVVVHVFGNIARMECLVEIAQKYNLKIIEDSTEALGSKYISGEFKEKFAGTIGDVGVYSFNGNKIITTGGGGMIVARKKELLERAKHLTTQAKSDPLYYTHDEVGYNYRMTNLQAAIGLAQLEQLEDFIDIKKSHYDRYCDGIKNINGLKLMNFSNEIRANYWFYSLLVDESRYGMNRDELLKYLDSNGVQTRPVWGLVSDQIPYKMDVRTDLENAEKCYVEILNIPCSTNLKKEDVDYVIELLNKGSKLNK